MKILTLPRANEIALELRPHVLVHNPLAAGLQQRVQIANHTLRARNAAQTLHRDDRVNASLRHAAFSAQLLRSTADDLVDIAQTGFDGVRTQLGVQALVRLDAIDFRDAGVESASKEEKPLSRAGADVEEDASGVVLNQRCDFWGGIFGSSAAEPGPEAGEPVVFEGGDVGEGLEIEGCEEMKDGGGDVVG